MSIHLPNKLGSPLGAKSMSFILGNRIQSVKQPLQMTRQQVIERNGPSLSADIDDDMASDVTSIAIPKRHRSYIRGRDTTYGEYGISEYQTRIGTLSYELLRDIYVKSSYVRPCVDAIVRSISSCPWVVRPFPGGDKSHAAKVREFLMDPNSNEESFRAILAKVLTDVMVIDEGIIEKVKSLDGTLLELFARDGATFSRIKDEYGVLHGYVQQLAQDADVIEFSIDEIIYLEMFPTTWNSFGLPIIETIVNEVATLMFSVEWIADSFTQDKIPPGILVLDKIGREAFTRAKAEFQGGAENAFSMKMFRNVGDAKWIELKKTNAEMQLAELNLQVERIVYRNFGIQPFEMGVTAEINRATAEIALRLSQSRMYKPLIQIVNFYMNQNLIHPIFPDVYFKLIPMDIGNPEIRSKTISNYVKQGILEKAEARLLLEDEFFVEGGLA